MTEVARQSTEVAARPAKTHPSDFDANSPGDWAFITIPVLGAGAGLLLRGFPWWVIALLGVPIGAVFLVLSMRRVAVVPWWSLLVPSRPQSWQADLMEICCVGCGRDLDWATPDMAARPVHRCPACVRAGVHAPAVVIPQGVDGDR